MFYEYVERRINLVSGYQKMGWNPIPISRINKDNEISFFYKWGEYKNKRYDWSPDDYKYSQGIAIVCGRISDNLVVIDVDNTLILKYNAIVETISDLLHYISAIQRTPSGGFHLFIHVDEPIEIGVKHVSSKLQAEGKGELLSIRYEGSLVNVCDSFKYINNKRVNYEWVFGFLKRKISPADLQYVVDALCEEIYALSKEKIKINIKRKEEELRKRIEIELKDVGKTNESSFPPCIERIYRKALAGENLSHAERFALATFLVCRRWSDEEIIKIFANLPNFKEERTRYHLEYIRKKKYVPYSCQKMRALELCEWNCKVKNPLLFGKRKSKKEKKEIKVS